MQSTWMHLGIILSNYNKNRSKSKISDVLFLVDAQIDMLIYLLFQLHTYATQDVYFQGNYDGKWNGAKGLLQDAWK